MGWSNFQKKKPANTCITLEIYLIPRNSYKNRDTL